MHAFQMIRKKICLKKIVSDFYFIFLESPETYAHPSLNEIGTKFNFSSTFLVEKSLNSQKSDSPEFHWLMHKHMHSVHSQEYSHSDDCIEKITSKSIRLR